MREVVQLVEVGMGDMGTLLMLVSVYLFWGNWLNSGQDLLWCVRIEPTAGNLHM